MAYFTGPNIVTDNLTFAIDAGSTRSYPGSGTTVTDLSGSNDVTLSGVGFATNNGGVFDYDGVDDQGTAGNFFNYQAFTINLWVNPGSTQNQYADIIDNNHTSSQNWVLQQNASVQNVYAFSAKGLSGTSSTPNFQLTAGDWVNLTFTYDGDKVRGYNNGVLFSTGSSLGTTINYSSQSFYIGKWGNGSGRYWEGEFGPLYCYNAALSAAQVLQNFNAQKSRFGL